MKITVFHIPSRAECLGNRTVIHFDPKFTAASLVNVEVIFMATKGISGIQSPLNQKQRATYRAICRRSVLTLPFKKHIEGLIPS